MYTYISKQTVRFASVSFGASYVKPGFGFKRFGLYAVPVRGGSGSHPIPVRDGSGSHPVLIRDGAGSHPVPVRAVPVRKRVRFVSGVGRCSLPGWGSYPRQDKTGHSAQTGHSAATWYHRFGSHNPGT